MSKRIHHMGMTLTKEEHERWHEKNPELTPRRHDALMKKLGISPEQDAEWHRTHDTLHEQRRKDRRAINAFALGGAFLGWCVRQGWLVQEGRRYFVTGTGADELRKRFEIEL